MSQGLGHLPCHRRVRTTARVVSAFQNVPLPCQESRIQGQTVLRICADLHGLPLWEPLPACLVPDNTVVLLLISPAFPSPSPFIHLFMHSFIHGQKYLCSILFIGLTGALMYHGLERKKILRCHHGCRGVGKAILLYLISLV